MTSTTNRTPKPGGPQPKEKSGQTLDLSPQDLKRYLSQPVRAIFHEQAKSIVAIQVRRLRDSNFEMFRLEFFIQSLIYGHFNFMPSAFEQIIFFDLQVLTTRLSKWESVFDM